MDQPLSALTESGGSRYGYDDFTESQPVEGEEYVPSTKDYEVILQQVQVPQGLGQAAGNLGLSTSIHGTIQTITTTVDTHTTTPAITTRREEGLFGSAPTKKKLTSAVWEDFIISYTRNTNGSKEKWGTY